MAFQVHDGILDRKADRGVTGGVCVTKSVEVDALMADFIPNSGADGLNMHVIEHLEDRYRGII